ncbi:DUF6268 family outer membrane beta-barrel protein [Maribacter sp. 2307ULW6-5]|uniref:DUF6268 family outer membrane beta-barrel protein n=1 Tax=Maribacter sp. 2307ULW6-5 TaxID=3386275 RepID=UPI0039BD09CF
MRAPIPLRSIAYGKALLWALYPALFLFVGPGHAQTPDVFRAEYMIMPSNRLHVETIRYKGVLNLPIRVGKTDFLILGGEYNKFRFGLPANLIPNPEELEHFHVADINLAYVHQWNKDWRLIAAVTPRWASNFTQGTQREDFVVNFTAGALTDRKDLEKPYLLVLGLSYNATAPVRVPLPVVYFEKRFHPKWAYILGVPKTGLKYFTKKNHFFQTEFFLDGYYVNVQNDILLGNNGLATDVSSVSLLWAAGYQYKFTKEMSVYLMAGHTIFQNGVLRDGDRSANFTLNDGPSLYLRTGFRIGI